MRILNWNSVRALQAALRGAEAESPVVKIATPVIRVNTYRLLAECVERGVALGWQRAHKHTSEPTEASLKEHIEREVMGEVGEYFSFDDAG